MAQQHSNDDSSIHMTRKQMKEARNNPMSGELEGYMLHIPENILNKIHDDIRNDENRLRGHLVRAVKIGLLSIEGGEFTLSTERIENVINSTSTSMADKYQQFDQDFSSDLTALIDQKLTGKNLNLQIA